MKHNKELIEKRLNNIKDLYFKLDELMDYLPDVVPKEVKEKLKKIIVEDVELKRLMQGIEEHRPPRFLVVGKTGVGKSSLINAICGLYVAEVSDIEIGTKDILPYRCQEGDRILLELLDTRGIGEPVSSDPNISAEEMLHEKIVDFRPDAILLVLDITDRARVNLDAEYVFELRKRYEKETKTEIPVVTVLNCVDRMKPEEIKAPKAYPHRKLDNIKEAKNFFEGILDKSGLRSAAVVPVSSYIVWAYDSKEMNQMSKEEREKAEIVFDGRYNIEGLVQELEKNMEVDASMGLLFAASIDNALARIANKFIAVFASIGAAIAAVPIPLSGIITLTTLEVILVTVIAYLAGEEWNLKAAQKFLGSLAGVGVAANVFKLTATELVKLVPGAGALINAGVASTGVYSVGKMAVQYYIYGVPMPQVKKQFKRLRNGKEGE